MLVLSIDTATKACAVGLCRDGKILAEYKINMGMTHSEGLMPQLEQLLERTGVQKADIDLIAVSMGNCRKHGTGFFYRAAHWPGNG